VPFAATARAIYKSQMPALSAREISSRLSKMEGWELSDKTIKKDFKFDDFKQAIAFINKVAAAAEELNHHPDIHNSYNKVSISLSTHSEGGLTDKDFHLATKTDSCSIFQ
jgi:4a-hydroxytetrahydrobiopterin dehydratase